MSNLQHLIIREATEQDAEQTLWFGKILFSSSDQVLITPGEFTNTLEQQKEWIAGFQKSDSILLVAEQEGKVVGVLDVRRSNRKKIKHIAEFGVSVLPDFENRGIATKLIQTFLGWAEKESQIEKAVLTVFATNGRAIALYSKLGFTEECRHIKAIRQETGEYVDLIQMYKFIRNI